jgi:hypothetical protein
MISICLFQREEVIVPGNDPAQCRCGEVIMRTAQRGQSEGLDEVNKQQYIWHFYITSTSKQCCNFQME